MRWLFLLLLLSNVGYFAWQSMKLPSPQPQRVSAPAAQGLALLSELPEAERPPLREAKPEKPAEEVEAAEQHTADDAAEEVVVEPVVTKPARMCLELKGFEKHAEAEGILKALLDKGMRLEGRGDELVPRSNYWVLLPPYASRAEAEAVIRQLKAKKLRDFYRVRSGESTNAISLGVFSSRELAERRYQQVVRLRLNGPKPQIKLLELQAKRHWLRLSYRADDASEWLELVEKSETIQHREWQCEESR